MTQPTTLADATRLAQEIEHHLNQVLIGQRQPHPAPFEQMQWSHANVMADTRRRLQRAGLSLWEGEPLWDLDEPTDLPRLPPGLARALRTGRVSR